MRHQAASPVSIDFQVQGCVRARPAVLISAVFGHASFTVSERLDVSEPSSVTSCAFRLGQATSRYWLWHLLSRRGSRTWFSTPRLDAAKIPKDQRALPLRQRQGYRRLVKASEIHLETPPTDSTPASWGWAVGEKLNRHTLHSLEHLVHSSRRSPASSKRFGLPRRPLPDCVARASTRGAAEKAPLVSRCSRLISRASAGRLASSFQLTPSVPAGASQPHSHETRENDRPPT